MLRSRSLLFALPFLLVFVGFGCKKSSSGIIYPLPSAINTPISVSTTRPAPYVKDPKKPKDQETGTDAQILLLRQVMKNLVSARSFRAKMSVPTETGTMHGDIEFSRGQGLHGMLTLSDQSTTEIYLIGQDVLFRVNTSTWTNFAFTPEGTRLARLFGSAFSLQGYGTTSTISDSARITSVHEDPSGCTLYVFRQPVADTGSFEKIQICVKDHLPSFFRVATQVGNVEVHYRDFNQTIPIVYPRNK